MSKLIAPHPEPVRVELKYILSDRGVEEFVANTGNFPPRIYTMDLALPELPTPDLRRRAYQLYVRLLPTEAEVSGKFDPDILPEDFFEPEDLYPQLDEPTEDPTAVIEAWERFHSKMDEQRAEAAKRKAERSEIEKIQREAFRLEMSSWIRVHGNERLKLAHQRGYKVSTLYARDRAAAEFPGFELDTRNKALWRDRTNPSAEALLLEGFALARTQELGQNYKVRIAWLTRDTEGNDLSTENKHEVVVVPSYLYFYTLLGNPDDVELAAKVAER